MLAGLWRVRCVMGIKALNTLCLLFSLFVFFDYLMFKLNNVDLLNETLDAYTELESCKNSEVDLLNETLDAYTELESCYKRLWPCKNSEVCYGE
jgi:hypothetical protein